MRKCNVCTVIVVVVLSMFVFGCSKYDKISILGTWEIDVKAAKGLGDGYEFAIETIKVTSGSDQPYTQSYEAKIAGSSAGVTAKWERWTISGNIERKKDKMTFINRIKDDVDKQGDTPAYPYRVEGDKLILVIENEGYTNNEKIYTKK